MTNIAFIFARGGSKGVPNKNILDFCGKPLIAWSIEQAKQVIGVKRVIVSTDSLIISDIAKKYGAEVPFIRPEELAQDDSSEWLAWRHALTYIKVTEGRYPEMFLSLPATAPLRSIEDVKKCIEKFQSRKFDIVITVSKARRNPYFNMVVSNSKDGVELVIPTKKSITRRQDAPIIYDMATVCYVADPQFIMECQGIFDGKVGAICVDAESGVDIDTYLDFKFAEYLFMGRHG